ncbi:MAG: HEPN domain-containing protein [Victivallaceae bacterium]|nr:HEPN domain-containing protein [Victivallaceae bacterium]
MKKSLSHLPEDKRDELRAVTGIITEMIDAEFIILFGSYARGNWVEDRYVGDDGILYEYQSDYDLLIVVKDLPKYQYKGYRNKIKRKARLAAHCATRLSIIMHSIEEVKAAIKRGNYFFCDIKKEGIQLYSSRRFRLPVVTELNLKQRLGNAERDFRNWFESASSFFITYNFVFERKDYKQAAFLLHQVTEHFYHAVLLAFTGYKAKLHDLEELGIQIDRLSPEFKEIFPKNTDEGKRLFKLLRSAYVGARYDMGYKISQGELEYLAERVKLLQAITEKVCKGKIKSFESGILPETQVDGSA